MWTSLHVILQLRNLVITDKSLTLITLVHIIHFIYNRVEVGLALLMMLSLLFLLHVKLVR